MSETTPSAPTAFTLTENPYSNWEGRINPPWYMFRHYGRSPHKLDVSREYMHELLTYLTDHGAEMIEKEVKIKDPSRRASEDDDDGTITDLIKDFGYEERSYSLLWYRGALIATTGDDALMPDIYYNPTAPFDLAEFDPYLRPQERAGVSILLESPHSGLIVRKVDFKAPKIDDLELSYGTGFAKVHSQLVERLSRNVPGIIMARGPMGTGKSTYIKHLTSIIDREFIFIPISMVSHLSSPGFVKLLMEHKESVLVLEDAEQALTSRAEDAYNSATVSTLLNLSDGILGTLLNCTILATFNADKQTIDKALLRKGRLLFDYEFTKLSIKDARRMVAHLGKTLEIDEPTSLADIYNADEDTNYVAPVRETIGFGRAKPVTTPRAG